MATTLVQVETVVAPSAQQPAVAPAFLAKSIASLKTWASKYKLARGPEGVGCDMRSIKGNLMHVAVGWIVMVLLTPSIEQCAEFRLGWISFVVLRSFCLGFLIFESTHQYLYKSEQVGKLKKFNPEYPPESQHWRDRLFSCMSFLINAAMECYILQAWASGRVPYVKHFMDQPLSVILSFLIYPFFRDIHTFIVHYPMHFEPIYTWVHAHHHRSWNCGPWSALSFTPIESSLNFMGPLIPGLITPCHPLLYYFANLRFFISSVYGHHGFEDYGGSFFHYLHHSRLNVNYGNTYVPIDILFGTWCNGEDEDDHLAKAKTNPQYLNSLMACKKSE